MPQLFILALDGCLASTVYGLVELFRIANKIEKQMGQGRHEAFELSVVSLDGKAVRTEEGKPLSVEGSLGKANAGEVLVLPGCMTHDLDMKSALKDRGAAVEALKAWHKGGHVVAAHCSSIFLLADAGLLNGRRATATWWAQDQLAASYPDVLLSPDETLIDEGEIICAAGPFSHLDLGLHLIEKMKSRSLASLVAKFAMIERSPPNQSAFRTLELTRHAPTAARQLKDFVRQRLPHMPTIKEAADHVGMTTRTLQRRMLEATEKTPQAYMNDVRMGVAKSLIETSSAGVSQLMAATGFVDESAFRRQFKRASGMTPKQYRERYGAVR